ncbi:Uncharacterised protein [Mycobacteroides abscessus subsp. abscessus]|nr:Uncharacterised protein [Mycobacteroides abscessus subsp. abscessus]
MVDAFDDRIDMLTGDRPVAGMRRKGWQRRQGGTDPDQPLRYRGGTSQRDQQLARRAPLRRGYPAAVQHPGQHRRQVLRHVPQLQGARQRFDSVVAGHFVGDLHAAEGVEAGGEVRCDSHNT